MIFSSLRSIQVLVLGLVLLTVACTDSPDVAATAVPSPTVTPLKIGIADPARRMGEIIENYGSRSNSDMALQTIYGSNLTLLNDLVSADLDAVVSPYPEPVPALWTNPIAMDGLVFVLHPENPTESITLKDLQRIFSGFTLTWPDIVASQETVSLVVPEPESGILTLFQERVMGDRSVSGGARILFDSQNIGEVVQTDEGTIVLAAVGATGNEKLLAVEGIGPTPATLTDQSYPLAFPLYWASLEEPSGKLRELLAWLQSEEGQVLIGDYYGRVR